jgi:cytochrome c oxidase cbb3-type subunit III
MRAIAINMTRGEPNGGAWIARIAGLMAFAIAGCGGHFPATPPPRPVAVEDIVKFEPLYDLHCAGCHGKDGKFGPAPPLNDPLFLAIVSKDDLLRVIAEGRHETLMPAWAKDNGGPLTAAQVKALAEGLKKQKEWIGTAKSDNATPPYRAPDDQPGGDKEAGAKLFAMACAGCHGEQGHGGEKRKDKPPIGPVNDPAFLALLSDQALRRLIITGRSDLHMPGWGPAAGRPKDFKPLTSADVSDLVALLAYWRVGGK